MDAHTAPDWSRAALLTIDMQRDFALPGAPAEIPGTMDVAPANARLAAAFRHAGRPIIHVVRLYLPDGTNVDACRRAAVETGALRVVLPDSDGAELVDTLAPPARLDAALLLGGGLQRIGPTEWVMYKPRWSAFHGTPLDDHLRSLDVSTVVVCGCNYPNCPRATIYAASERDYRIVAVTDAISGFDDQGKRQLAAIGVATLPVDACLRQLDACAAGSTRGTPTRRDMA